MRRNEALGKDFRHYLKHLDIDAVSGPARRRRAPAKKK
jgi:hypothetical protein